METVFNIMVFCIAAYIFFNYVLKWILGSLFIVVALIMYLFKTIYLSIKKKIRKVSK